MSMQWYMSDDRRPGDRARDRRESVMWMILAGLGTIIPLGFSFISRTHLRPGTGLNVWIEFIVFSIVLIAAIPFAVKVNHELALPGGPLITATLNHEPQPYGWGEVLLAGVLWSVIALLVFAVAFFVGVGLLFYFFPSFIPRIPARQIQHAPIVKPSWIWLASGVVTSAVSAGVQEEILFRFVLVGLVSWALMTFRGNADQRPRRGQLWLANIVQAYFFSLAHFVSDFHLTRGIIGLGKVAICPVVRPQAVVGVFLGWLYLRHGLETAMVSHIFFDLLVLFEAPAAIR